MKSVFSLAGPKIFDLASAQSLIPIFIRMTERAQGEIRTLVSRLDEARAKGDMETDCFDNEIDSVMDRWRNQVTRLGGHPKGIWTVDFDNGSGFYCWKYPERTILYQHGYKDGNSGRRPIRPVEISIETSQEAESMR